jgi:hypothetical protein
MHAVVRAYNGKGAKELMDVLEKNKGDVESIMRGVNGFISYTLVRSGNGGYSVTVCNDKAGVDESVKRARDWVVTNAGATGVGAPDAYEGTVITHVKA